MVSRRGRKQGRGKTVKEEDEAAEMGGESDVNRTEYEESRAQRIKENMERMKSLGIVDLSKQLNRPSAKPSSSSLRKTKPTSTEPSRRSSRYTIFYFILLNILMVISIIVIISSYKNLCNSARVLLLMDIST